MKVTEIQVLERAIKDAMKGGLSKLDLLALLPPGHTDQHIMVMLYDHRFNRALWGETHYGRREVTVSNHKRFSTIHTKGISKKPKEYTKNVRYTVHGWEYHIQKMALSEDPLAYIAKVKYGIKVE